MGECMSPNATRLWICDRCGRIYRRYLSGPQATPTRLHCGQRMRAARSWPSPEWYRAFQKKSERHYAERREQESHFSRAWNSEGRILEVSTASRRAYRELEQLKYGGSFFVKRATKLLVSLRKDLGQYGSGGVPTVRFDTVPGCHGHYARSLMRGVWEIALTPGFTLAETLATFIHETLHWIDDQAGSHPRFGKIPSDHFRFEERLLDLRKRLGIKI